MEDKQIDNKHHADEHINYDAHIECQPNGDLPCRLLFVKQIKTLGCNFKRDWFKLQGNLTYFEGTINDQTVRYEFEEANYNAHNQHERKQIVADGVSMIFHYLLLLGESGELQHQRYGGQDLELLEQKKLNHLLSKKVQR